MSLEWKEEIKEEPELNEPSSSNSGNSIPETIRANASGVGRSDMVFMKRDVKTNFRILNVPAEVPTGHKIESPDGRTVVSKQVTRVSRARIVHLPPSTDGTGKDARQKVLEHVARQSRLKRLVQSHPLEKKKEDERVTTLRVPKGFDLIFNEDVKYSEEEEEKSSEYSFSSQSTQEIKQEEDTDSPEKTPRREVEEKHDYVDEDSAGNEMFEFSPFEPPRKRGRPKSTKVTPAEEPVKEGTRVYFEEKKTQNEEQTVRDFILSAKYTRPKSVNEDEQADSQKGQLQKIADKTVERVVVHLQIDEFKCRIAKLPCPIEWGRRLFEAKTDELADVQKKLTLKLCGTLMTNEESLDELWDTSEELDPTYGWKCVLEVLKFRLFFARRRETFEKYVAMRPDIRDVSSSYQNSMLPTTEVFIRRVDREDHFYDCVQIFKNIASMRGTLRAIVNKCAAYFLHSYMPVDMMPGFSVTTFWKLCVRRFPRDAINSAIEIICGAITADTDANEEIVTASIALLFVKQIDMMLNIQRNWHNQQSHETKNKSVRKPIIVKTQPISSHTVDTPSLL